MIPKKREDHLFMEGAGIPYERPERKPIEKEDAERQKPLEIDLDDLNNGKGPHNFHRKAGRTLMTLTKRTGDQEGDEDDIE